MEKFKKNSNKFIPLYLLLFLMILTPQGNQFIKYVLVTAMIIQVTAIALTKRTRLISKNIFLMFVLYICLGLMYGIYGYIEGNLGAAQITKLTTIYVIFGLFITIIINNLNAINSIHRTIVFSSIFLSLYIIITILHTQGIWPDWLYLNISGQSASHGVSRDSLTRIGRFDVGFSSIASFAFVQPYLFAYIVANNKKTNKTIWSALILTSVIAMFSGARILVIVAIVIPAAIAICFRLCVNPKFIKYNKQMQSKLFNTIIVSIFSIIVALTILVPLGLSYDSYMRDMIRGFLPVEITNIYEGGASASAYVNAIYIKNRRVTQFEILTEVTKQKPLFGYGSGAVAEWQGSEYIRSASEPWSYELLYSQFLFNWGIIGCLIYGFGLLYIYKQLLIIFENDKYIGPIALAALFGSLGFMIGSSVNHYLLRFDSLYVIFIPVAIVNAYKLRKTFEKKFANTWRT